MPQLTLRAAALDAAVDGLLNLYVLVCDAQGELVTGLPARAFACTASTHPGSPVLHNEGVVEQHAGCYHLAVSHGADIRVDLITLSVRQTVRANPVGLSPVHGTVAEGHELVGLKKRAFDL